MMSIKNLWEMNLPDEYELEDLTKENIEKAENKLSIKFPESYLDILKKKNGGRLRQTMLFPNIFPVNEDIGDEGDLVLDHLLGISERECEGVLTTLNMRGEWGLPDDIVLLSGDGHWSVVLDYRNYTGDNPPVSYLDSEYEIDKQIAVDFESFLNQLRAEEIPEELRKELEEFELAESKIEYTPKKIEKAVKNGRDIATITAGLEYMAKNECDVDWLMDQMVRVADNSDYYAVFTCAHYFLERLKTAKKQEIDMSKMELLIDKLAKYPVAKFYDSEEIVPRQARRIQKAITSME